MAIALERAVILLGHPLNQEHQVLCGVPSVHEHRLKRHPSMRHRAQHLTHMIELCLAICVRIEDPVIDHPEALSGGVDVHTRDYPNAPNDALVVAAPLLACHLDGRPKALLQHGVIRSSMLSSPAQASARLAQREIGASASHL